MSKNGKRILFLKRPDYISKHGGDISLINGYMALADGLGHEVLETADPFSTLAGVDVVFAINLDRPYENYIMLQRCLSDNVTFFLYTLHHPTKGVNQYLKSKWLTGARKKIARLSSYQFTAYESLMSILRVCRNPKLRNLRYCGGLNSSYGIKFLIKHSSSLLIANEAEKCTIEKDFNVSLYNYHYLTHISNSVESPTAMVNKDRMLIVCAGRVEPRKNQMQLLNVAKLLPDFDFVFVGEGNPSANDYYELYTQKSMKLSNVKIMGTLPLPELRELFLQADIFVSLSYFEVVSLTELEAYAQFCKMVISRNSYIDKHIGCDCVEFVDIDNKNEVFKAIIRLSRTVIDVDLRASNLQTPKYKELSTEAVQNSLGNILDGLA